MGIWHKTLFYLGLVDEDDPGSYSGSYGEPYGGASPPGRQAPVAQRQHQPEPVARRTPTVQRRSVDQTGGGEMSRPDVGMRHQPQQQRQMDQREAEQRAAEQREYMNPPRNGVQGRRVEPPLTPRRRTSADGALAEAGVVIRPADSPLVRTVTDNDLETEVIVATSYSDAQLLADHIRATIPVILDLRKVEPAMVRRLVDFASGLTYALGGSMRKIGQGVILVTPANVNLSRDERRRLKELGYYQAPEEG
jgi:cell division inhibitor SepF